MGVSLIEQYCSAIEQWAEITDKDQYDPIVYSMMHSGGFLYVRPEGAVENPYAPEHRDKELAELEGRYTIEQLRAHLEFIANDVGVMEDTLICGLIRSVETEFTHLAVGYKEAIEKRRQAAEELQQLYEHPEEYPEEVIRAYTDSFDRARQRYGLNEPFKREDFLRAASLFWKMSHPPEDEEAQRKSWLAAWKRVTAPILEHDNLSRWASEYLARMARQA